MPRGKGRGRGRGKKQAEEEEVAEVEQLQEEVQPEPEPEKMMDFTNTEDLNGQQKRKAEEYGDGDAKKPKTDEIDPDKPVTLFCGNLDPDLLTETLKVFFEASGITTLKCRKIDFKRFGYVDVNPEQLEAALALSGKDLNGEAIRVCISKPRPPEEKGAEDRTLFVKNFNEKVTEQIVKDFFAGEGREVTSVRLPTRPNGLPKGFAYVVFDTKEGMEAAREENKDSEWEGTKLHLDYTNDKIAEPKDFGPSKVLFVRNLSFQVSEDELMETFEGCVTCRIPPNEFGLPKGFAFVEFKTVEEAEAAQKDKDGLEINGRVVQLAFAHDNKIGGGGYPPRGAFGWGPPRGGPRGGGWFPRGPMPWGRGGFGPGWGAPRGFRGGRGRPGGRGYGRW